MNHFIFYILYSNRKFNKINWNLEKNIYIYRCHLIDYIIKPLIGFKSLFLNIDVLVIIVNIKCKFNKTNNVVYNV